VGLPQKGLQLKPGPDGDNGQNQQYGTGDGDLPFHFSTSDVKSL
jgi:hypothetical protein